MKHEDILKEMFKEDPELYDELIAINKQLNEKINNDKKPILIEFSGSARSGKTSVIKSIAEVLRKYDNNVEVIDEEFFKITKDINKNSKKKKEINSLDYTKELIKQKIDTYDYAKKLEADIVFWDRGINDEFNWLKTFGEKDCKFYDKKLGKRKVDLLIMQVCDVMTSLKRKYGNSLYIKPNKWTNYEVCSAYLKAVDENSNYFDKHANNILKIDTSDLKIIEASIIIIKEIFKILY